MYRVQSMQRDLDGSKTRESETESNFDAIERKRSSGQINSRMSNRGYTARGVSGFPGVDVVVDLHFCRGWGELFLVTAG